MQSLTRIVNLLTSKALGSVDAGACTADRGCCCDTSGRYGYDCGGNCIITYCSFTYSVYGSDC